MFDPRQLERFPTQPGVYLMKDKHDKILYVGKAKQLKNRIKHYFLASGDSRSMIPFLTAQIASIDTIVVPSEKEALLLENTLIKKHQPKFNACLKDDKTFISLMVNTSHPWPMLRLIRYKEKPRDKGIYFGPYPSAYAARQTYELLTRLFPLRQCSDEELKRRTRPCLLYSIKRCVAPCVERCTQEEYQDLVAKTIQFLRGHDQEILKNLYREMHELSEKLEYERAAALLHTIRQVEHVIETQPLLHKAGGKNTDVIALYRQGEEIVVVQLLFREGKLVGSEHHTFSHILETDEELLSSFLLQHYPLQQTLPEEILLPLIPQNLSLLTEILCEAHGKKIALSFPQKGEKKSLLKMAEENARTLFQQKKDLLILKEKMLLDLQEKLKLTRYPKKIICFDTSHSGGSDPVAALAAFTDGIQDRKKTRLFHIRHKKTGDDYAAMHEAIHRYLTRAKEGDDLPDLLIVDGGKGHLHTAQKVFQELNIASVDLIGFTKEEGRHDKGMTQERIFLPEDHDPIHLNPRSNLLFFLQQIRDAAHLKAISFHRKQRKKRTIKTTLDEIAGIGPVKRTRLLTHFKSVAQIRNASDEALKQVKGITQKDIDALRQHLYPS